MDATIGAAASTRSTSLDYRATQTLDLKHATQFSTFHNFGPFSQIRHRFHYADFHHQVGQIWAAATLTYARQTLIQASGTHHSAYLFPVIGL